MPEIPFDSPETDQKAAPLAFISYSHDSKEHKAWVSSLAAKLRANGVEVLFDQFDLEPGSDVTKYMEHSVAAADCVLMICTEAYVRKADDGKGGVGYETMVVTGELVKNLGLNKFVPIFRQSGEDRTLPRCVGTRYYVDLSDDAVVDDNFSELLKKIHNVPKLKKEPLGPNPFAAETFEGKAAKVKREERRLEFSAALSDPESAYQRALEVIDRNDSVAWRRLLRAAREKGIKSLLQLYTDSENSGFLRDGIIEWPQLIEKSRDCVACYAEFIACLVAAAETGNQAYAGQLGWIDELRSQSDWVKSGFTYWVDMPDLIFFVTQALVGAMLMESGRAETAFGLATTKVSTSRQSESMPLFKQANLIGWPQVLDHDCTKALDFLNSTIDRWEWLHNAFGTKDRAKSGVSAYYLFLSLLDFMHIFKSGNLQIAPGQFGMPILSVPFNFIVWSPDAAKSGYQLMIRQASFIAEVLQKNGIGQTKLKSLWPTWMQINYQWIGQVFLGGLNLQIPYVNLPVDLESGSYAV